MFKKIFKKKENKTEEKKSILIAALLIHAAKIDEKYTDVEKEIILKAIMDLDQTNREDSQTLLNQAEKKEEESNQIVEFTKEIKKYPMEFRLRVIEIIWKIVYSDKTNDDYESNLIRRICGLLYVSDADNGIIKKRVQDTLK
jgi:uncharacterized tellurite resistance protein B-like protein